MLDGFGPRFFSHSAYNHFVSEKLSSPLAHIPVVCLVFSGLFMSPQLGLHVY